MFYKLDENIKKNEEKLTEMIQLIKIDIRYKKRKQPKDSPILDIPHNVDIIGRFVEIYNNFLFIKQFVKVNSCTVKSTVKRTWILQRAKKAKIRAIPLEL